MIKLLYYILFSFLGSDGEEGDMDLEAQVMMDKMDDTLSDADGKDLGGCCSDEDEEDDSITGSLNMPHAHPHGPAAMHHGPHHINGAPMPPGKNTYCITIIFSLIMCRE